MFEFQLTDEIKKRRIKLNKKEDIEPQEIFLDVMAKQKEKELGISEIKIEIPLPKKIIKFFRVIFILIILFLLFRTFQLQVFNHDIFLKQAKNNQFFYKSLKSLRGVIYDSKMNQLVYNKLSFDLIFDKTKFLRSTEERKNILKTVANILNEDENKLEKMIEESKDNVVLIYKNIDFQNLVLLESKINDLPGFEIKTNSIREYSDGSFFSHIIGYMGPLEKKELDDSLENEYSILDYIGKTGLEKSYENILREKKGEIQVKKDVYGNIISKEIISLPEPGKSLVLFIDADLQKKITEEMKKVFLTVGAKRGAAIAMDPKTGGILALVSLPNFDNNIFSNSENNKNIIKQLLEDKENPLYNRAISAQYPTGSTIKPLIAAAALEEKIISPSTKIDDTKGKIVVRSQYDPNIVYEYKDWRVHGFVDLRQAIAESCNVYFYTVGGGYANQPGLGPKRIKKYLELFGWGKETQIDLPNESKGFIPSPEWKKEIKKKDWFDGDTYNLSIGQGDILITPLQVVTAFSAVANGGTLLKPQIVKKIIDADKNVIEEYSPKIIRENFISPENLKIIREGMRMTVSGENAPFASAPFLNSLPVRAAAKTGTAETSKPNYYHNWITVFAPYENPEIVLTIVVEDVKGIQPTTIPIAKEVLNWYFRERQ